MSTTPDLPPLPEKRPISGQAGLNCVIWGKGHDDDNMRAYARTHADNCIRALTEDVGKTQEALRSALGEVEELKAENFTLAAMVCPDCSGDEGGTPQCCMAQRLSEAHAERDAALARAEKVEARAGSVPAGWVLVPAAVMCTRASPGDEYAAMLAAAPSAPSTPPDEATSQ